MIIEFKFNTPPLSVNQSLTVARGRNIKSKEARSWWQSMNSELITQKQRITKYCYYESRIFIPGKYGIDANNATKAILDVLCKAERTPDDFYNMRAVTEFYHGERIIVIIEVLALDYWAAIKNPSPGTLRKLKKGYQEIEDLQ